jgi:5'-3' exonuclease
MGVEGLYKFINKNCPNIYDNISIYDIKDRSCIIDGMQHIYTQLIYMRSKNKEVLTSNGKNISHIYGLINSLTYYLKYGIIPIFIFDGKSPEIKRKKIEERKYNLKQNLKKLKELESIKNNICDNIKNIQLNNELANNLTNELANDLTNDLSNDLANDLANNFSTDLLNDFEMNTPPDLFNLSDQMQKMHNIQEEYKKIYKKSIILKDYYIADWIEILEFLGLPVIKASGEADPLCSYILKNNKNIYGIISDDSDMLVFGAPVLMRKTINQQFTIIELEKLLQSINTLLESDKDYIINKTANTSIFTTNNLIEFSILLGTDYAIFNLKEQFVDSYDLLKYYMLNGVDSLINSDDIEQFHTIKKYYENMEFDNKYNYILKKPEWHKPKLMELKKRLLELDVDEDYIDKNTDLFDYYYNKYCKKNYNNYNNYYKN